MKEIKAIIQPFRLEPVIDALRGIKGLPAVTISTAHGLSVERGPYDPEAMFSVVDAKPQAALAALPGEAKRRLQTALDAVKTGS